MKTLTSEEVEQMHLLLKQYHPYVVERHGKKFGCKIFYWIKKNYLADFEQFVSYFYSLRFKFFKSESK
jgi:hypothetical protein